MFAETDFGLMADATMDTTDKVNVGFLILMALVAVGVLAAVAWNLRGVL